jgi:hypothetical protein
VEEGNEIKDRVLETVGFQGAKPICDGGGWTCSFPSVPRWRGWHGVPGVD